VLEETARLNAVVVPAVLVAFDVLAADEPTGVVLTLDPQPAVRNKAIRVATYLEDFIIPSTLQGSGQPLIKKVQQFRKDKTHENP
jgi:hypothetical protein